jgi:hypothetical protein
LEKHKKIQHGIRAGLKNKIFRRFLEVFWKTTFTFPGKMIIDTKFDEKLGEENFRAWKYRVGLLLEEHDLERFVEEVVPELEEDEAKAKHKKNQAMAKRIIAD